MRLVPFGPVTMIQWTEHASSSSLGRGDHDLDSPPALAESVRLGQRSPDDILDDLGGDRLVPGEGLGDSPNSFDLRPQCGRSLTFIAALPSTPRGHPLSLSPRPSRLIWGILLTVLSDTGSEHSSSVPMSLSSGRTQADSPPRRICCPESGGPDLDQPMSHRRNAAWRSCSAPRTTDEGDA